MRARTEAEIKAYIDGYNACYKQFCECLKVRPLWKAVKKMDLFVTAVNGCVEDEPQKDDAYFLELMGAVERGEISDAGANQAWYEYINHKDEPQTVRSNLEPFRVDEPQLTAKCLNCANGGSYKCSKCDGEMYFKDETQTEEPRCSVNGTPFDECGFCEYFNCDTCKCEADVPQTERSSE